MPPADPRPPHPLGQIVQPEDDPAHDPGQVPILGRDIEGVTQIIFQPEYAKRATSVGACQAEEIRHSGYDPKSAVDRLRRGATTSISTSITCSFPSLARSVSKIQTTSWPTRSSRGTSRSLNWTSRTTARPAVSRSGSSISSDPLASSGLITRQTTASTGAHSTWPSWPTRLASRSTISKDSSRLSFEISSELDITLHFRRQKTGYRRFPADAHSIAIGTELRVPWSPPGQGNQRCDGEATRWNPTKELAWDIAVNVTDEGHHMLFPAGTTFDQIARVDDQSTLRFATASGPMPDPPRDGEYRISARRPGDTDWRTVGMIQLVHPRKFDFKWSWRATLDQQGVLRFVVGEVPYDCTASTASSSPEPAVS